MSVACRKPHSFGKCRVIAPILGVEEGSQPRSERPEIEPFQRGASIGLLEIHMVPSRFPSAP